ncbi:hypothetical protein FOA52_013784 [Chlamydomonas sp. UWO 241]|nr:hypothetical protein FOA52_013784 [Chlamydomonas sp. UWO 241]
MQTALSAGTRASASRTTRAPPALRTRLAPLSAGRNANGNGTGERWAELKAGVPTSGPSLAVTVNGLTFPNPFVIGSGPPGTNYQVMKKAFDEGWGGVIVKTMSLDSSKVINVSPRYAKLRDTAGKVFGWENFELISDRSFETMLEEMKRLKQEYPNQV